MALTPERISEISDEQSLYRFLANELDWPIQSTPDTFEFFPDELGLTEAETQQIRAVRQIANFDRDQPWGIFLVEFMGDRGVYQTALRRVLRGLSESRRDRDATLPAWKSENLLFICTPNYRDFTFAHFQGKTHTQATLTRFGWNYGDTALRTLCTENLSKLRYPGNTEDAAKWLTTWASAFDVEQVTTRFYDAYHDVFQQVESNMVEGVKRDRWLFTQRLFNRLMFIQFLSKRGWLKYNDRTDYLNALFEASKANGENFYNDRLYWVFFHGLGTLRPDQQGREAHSLKQLEDLRGQVPYLNGGLFAMDDEDDVRGAVTISNAAFELIFTQLFNRFNFTVEESTPLDIQVAVDPEMLGKVFEELVTGRHESGSYYTPRPVVAFMCKEALKAYLGGGIAITTLVDSHDARLIDVPTARGLLRQLDEFRCVDPACGSGAYILGMLQELFALNRLLDTRTNSNRDDYERKLSIIQKNLYGVDREEFAVSIARLRLWLSLIVEYVGETPEPLPNLDFKIERGDSLLGPNPQGGPQPDIFRQQDINEFERKKAQFADPYYTGDKVVLKREIEALRGSISAWAHPRDLIEGFDWRVEFAEVFEGKKSINPIAESANFGQELPEESTSSGFDVVLANPPYVRMELFKDIKPILKRNFSEVHAERADLYCYFYARAIQLLRHGGTLVFISSNKWLRSGYGANLRRYISATCSIASITDFGELPVFQQASTFPMIFIGQKGTEQSYPVFTRVESLHPPYPDVLAVIQREGRSIEPEMISGADWTLAESGVATRMSKMDRMGVPLIEYVDGRIFYGIKTGYNDAFYINTSQRLLLIEADPKSAEVIKPLIVGDDVRKWRLKDHDLWLIYLARGSDPNRYPAIVRYLSQYRTRLEARATNQPWFELQQPQARYAATFIEPKILFPDIAKESRFTLDTSGAYINDTVFAIGRNDKYLLGVLNSYVVWEYLCNTAAVLGDANKGGRLRLKYNYISKVPIPDASEADRAVVTALVQKCLDARGIDCESWEAEINERVATLYGL